MPERPHSPRTSRRPLPVTALLLTLAAGACTTVGPNHQKPVPAAPDDWTSWRSGDASLRGAVNIDATLPADWWTGFNDPVLNELQKRAIVGSPDLETAALHVAQARLARGNAAAQGLPDLGLNAQVSRQRQSEYGAATRLLDAVAGNGNRDTLAKLLAEPYTLYQGGLDASWEIDFWGRVSRSIEAADADVARQASLLDLARLNLQADVARTYFELRTTQRRIALTQADSAALGERLVLVTERTRGGASNHLELERQRTEWQASEAQLPALRAQEAAGISQIAYLLGERPGALNALLQPAPGDAPAKLPDLALGLPSEIALRRPDIRAAEARLHAATANIGVARADLYPSIRLGGGFGLESYRSENLFDWASRTWSIGPSLNLPLFDGGRRRRVVELRELEQKEAAVAYQQVVLGAWKEIDDGLNGYTAEQQQNRLLAARKASAEDAYGLASARYKGGVLSYLELIDSQRSAIQAARDLNESNGRLGIRFVALNKAIGNSPGALSPENR